MIRWTESATASVGHRTYYSVDRFDWDLGFDFLIPGLFQGDDFDFDNNGRTASSDAIALLFGGQIQYKAWGIGAGRGSTSGCTSGLPMSGCRLHSQHRRSLLKGPLFFG